MNETNSSDKQHSSEGEPQPSAVVEAHADNKKKVTRQKASDPDHKKSYRRSWRSSQPTTKLMIIFTGVMALATTLYMVFSGWQLYEIRSGGEETRKLAQAARESADAAQRQANVAVDQLQAVKESTQAVKESAAATKTATEQNKELIKAADAQARASEKSSQTATQALIIGAQAYLAAGVDLPKLNADKPLEFSVTIINQGNSPATLDLRWDVRLNEKLKMPIFDYSSPNSYIPATFILPKKDRKIVLIGKSLTADEISKIRNGNLYIFLAGKGEFSSVGHRQAMTFCFVYYGKDDSWSECADLIQEADKDNPN